MRNRWRYFHRSRHYRFYDIHSQRVVQKGSTRKVKLIENRKMSETKMGSVTSGNYSQIFLAFLTLNYCFFFVTLVPREILYCFTEVIRLRSVFLKHFETTLNEKGLFMSFISASFQRSWLHYYHRSRMQGKFD